MLNTLSLRLRVFLIFAGLAGGILGVTALALWVAVRRLAAANIGYLGQSVPGLSAAGSTAAVIIVFGAAAMIVGVWYLFDRNVAKPIETLAGGLRTGAAPDLEESKYLADLGPAARAAAEARARQAEALAAAIQEHATELAREKATLESILADFGAGAVMTDAQGRVVFYNASAAQMLPGLALDRPLARFLRPAALDAARKRLAGGAEATDLTCQLAGGGAGLAGRMRQLDQGELLILRDRPGQRPLPRAALESLRRHCAALVPMLQALDGPMPPALVQALQAEGHGLARATHDLSEAASGGVAGQRASLAELATGLDAEALPKVDLVAETGAMNALLRLVDARLRARNLAPRLGVTIDDAEAQLALAWQGEGLAMDDLEAWLAEAPDADQPDVTGAEILAAHSTGMWCENNGLSQVVLPLPVAPKQAAPTGLTYDFALAGRGEGSTRLEDVTCVVFDTETTGLGPDARIVQIAGLRVARGRLTGERFDMLVNPGIPIPPASTAVHHITDAMVKDAPDLKTVLTGFSHFTDGVVMVAHNAPFDMGLLRAASRQTGLHFDNPVLDTVLLSAMIYGQAAVHTLDALCERLAIEIPPEYRHTAMGDSIVTAQAFLRLIPALKAKGLKTLEDVSVEARKFRRLIEDANVTLKTGHEAETVG